MIQDHALLKSLKNKLAGYDYSQTNLYCICHGNREGYIQNLVTDDDQSYSNG